MRPIHRSATKEQQILVEAAFDEGREIGREEMRTACIDFLESTGDHIGAQRLREAKIVNGEGAK